MGDNEANPSDADSVQHKPRARSASKTDLGDKRDSKKSKVAEHTVTQSVTPIPTTYAEMGAMRLPQVENHWRVFDLIKRVGLSGSVIPFKMSADQNNSFIYVNKTAIRKNDPKSNDVEQLQFPPNIVQLWNDYTCLKEGGRKLSADDIVTKIIQPFIDDLSASDPSGDVTSKKLLARDHHSLESYLREKLIGDFFIPKEKLEPFGLLSFLDIMASSTGLLELSLTEFVIDAWQFSGASKWSTIKGGMSRLVNELGHKLTTQVKKNCKVTKVTVSDGATPKVTLTHVENKVSQTSVHDHVIITVPLPVLRHIEFESPNTKDILGYEKREAIRDFGYDHSCKIFLRFSTRWWEQPPFNIVGGSSNTDLPNRVVVYPSYGQDRTDGVLLASYTWGTDAVRWAGMSNEDRCLQALENIIEMHKALIADPKAAHEFETKMRSWYQGGESICWTNEPTSLGAFSYLYPSQFGRMQQVVNEPVKGIVHFAGEHADIYHAWIAASLNSAYRAVKQVLVGNDNISKVLKDRFGKATFVKESKTNAKKVVTMATEGVHQQPATKISLQTFSRYG